MGVFGIAEIMTNLQQKETRDIFVAKVDRICCRTGTTSSSASRRSCAARCSARPSASCPAAARCWRRSRPTRFEKKIAKPPRNFGKGDIRGVAAPESANNAGAQTSFIPLLTLGIPSNPVMALMIGAMMIQGIAPGPQVMTERPQLFWGMIASMWVGNLMLVVLNLPLIGMWIKLLTVPYRLLYPAILVFCGIGVYSVNNSSFDIYMMAIFAVLGYVWVKLECEPAPLILGFILGPMMEENLRRAMLLSRGDPSVFVTKPISAVLLGVSLLLLIIVLSPSIKKKREEAFQEA